MKRHQPCPCGTSSDGLYDYGDHQYCFVCNKYFNKEESGEETVVDMSNTPVKMTGKIMAIKERKIDEKTVSFYRVLQDNGKHHYPYYKDGKLVAVKTRLPDKAGFPWAGSPGSVELFGQNLFSPGGNSITIVEGELDALSAYQMLNEPVVSVCSASTAVSDMKRNYEFINSFKRILFAFDNDKAGQEAQIKCATLFDPKKVRIVKLSLHKDASDYLSNDNIKEFYEQHRIAGPFTPDGIISGASIYDILHRKPEYQSVNYPWDGVNDYTYGLRTGELVTVIAGTGVGKTQFLRELVYGLLNKTEENIGVLFLEEPIRDTGLGIMSIHANKRMYLPDEEYSKEEFDEAFKNTIGSGRVYLYDSFGSNSIDRIIGTIRYLVRALDCKYIILDHISIVVSDQSSGDERRALDEIATKLKTLTVELSACVIMAAHLRRQPNGHSHEEGANVSLSDIRGTAGIGQLSNIILGLERNTQADDLSERHTVRVRVVKNRFSGMTGLATILRYHPDSGRLIEELPDKPVENEDKEYNVH
jgi:twinkle protein